VSGLESIDALNPADGAAVLDETHATLRKYVAFPSVEAGHAVTLWVAATHALPAFDHATRLVLRSPVKRCGKSRLMELLEALAYDPLATTNISVPSLFRIIDAAGERPPTLLLDEADRLFGSARKDEDNGDLIALLNNGFRRGRPTYRCVGPAQTPTPFSNYAMAAIAGIGRQPDTVEDRAVCVTMRRRGAGEHVSKFRQRRDLPHMYELRARLTAWAEAKADALAREPSNMPDGLEDRAEDAWEPLILVADAAGGEWPERARKAAVALTTDSAEADSESSFALRLLADIREIFSGMTVGFLPSNELLTRLRRIDDAPWRDVDLTTRKLSDYLREFGVKPRRNAQGTTRGYRLEDFTDAFGRYLAGGTSGSVRTVNMASDQAERTDAFAASDAWNRQTSVAPEASDALNRQTESNRQALARDFDALTGSDAPPEANGNGKPRPLSVVADSNGQCRPVKCAQCKKTPASGKVDGTPLCTRCEAMHTPRTVPGIPVGAR
jgi:hypothetical protein